MKHAVQFGAGNIGRGFLGQLYSDAGWRTTFVDVAPALLEGMRERGDYTIHIVGPDARDVPIRHVAAVDGRDLEAVAAAVDAADLVGTAVGVGALPHIAPALAGGLTRRAARGAGVDILICENLLDAGARLRSLLEPHLDEAGAAFLRERVGTVETVVSRMIPPPTEAMRAADPLAIAVEAYGVLPCDRKGFRNGIPDIPGLEPTPRIHAYEERKLFGHNCTHALASYFGWEAGHDYIWQVMEDPALRERIAAGGWESGRALCRKHGFTETEHAAHLEDLFRRFGNRALGDTTVRCGRDPVRKLGRRDRLVGAALLALEHGESPEVLTEGICAALRFRPEEDPSAGKLRERLEKEGLEAVLETVCGLRPEEPLFAKIRRVWTADGS